MELGSPPRGSAWISVSRGDPGTPLQHFRGIILGVDLALPAVARQIQGRYF